VIERDSSHAIGAPRKTASRITTGSTRVTSRHAAAADRSCVTRTIARDPVAGPPRDRTVAA
jgi:hypothetical protein